MTLNWKVYLYAVLGTALIIIGVYLKGHQSNGGFFTGLGVGFLVGTLLNIYPKLLNRKDETSTK
jgi:hypothetical protein